MRDSISIDRIKQTHPQARAIFTDFINKCEETHNITIRITEPVYRTIAEQNELYAQGRTTPGAIVTRAQGGQSYHNFGLAIDICILNAYGVDWNYNIGKFEPIAKKYGIEWGGDWHSIKDYPHFQITFGYSCEQLNKIAQAGAVDDSGYILLITV